MAEFDPYAPKRADPLVVPAREAAQDTSAALDPLPPGWVQHVDLNSGKEYYVHNVTGETNWSRPSVAQPHVMAAPVSMLFEAPGEAENEATGSLRKPSYDGADASAVSATGASSAAKQRPYQPPPQQYQPPVQEPSVQQPSVQQQYQAQQQHGPATLARLLAGKLHGECLARISLRTLLAKEWKPCFWVFDTPNVLLVFRERAHYLDYHANPYLTAAETDFLVKKRVVLAANLTAYPITQKTYGLFASTLTYNFKVEEQRDYGPATVVKFGAPAMSMLEDLRAAINDQIALARAKGRSAGR